MNHSKVVSEGGTQWMHAGRGITHSERPGKELADTGGESEIIQFWVNSPARHKMDTPSYQPISRENTPVLKKGNTEIAVVAGTFEGHVGPAETLTLQTLLRITSTANDNYSLEIPAHYNCLIYLLDGRLIVNEQQVEEKQLVWFKNNGELIHIRALQNTRAIVLSGVPIGESVASYGPFVMNTQTEIMQALRDSQQGKMGVLIEEF